MTIKNKIKIMLVDDDTFMLNVIHFQLAKQGFTAVSTYSSAAQALAQLNSPDGQPELIFLDLNMPGMDGIEFLRHLPECDFKGGLILISIEDERLLQSACALARAHKLRLIGHLHKPIANQALAQLLEAWIAPQRQRVQAAKGVYSAEALHWAIENSELVNYYQPQVAVSDGRVVGVETLVRWWHPVDGVVFPDQFIGVAEASGLIDDLSRVVLRQALAQARYWHDKGLTLRVAVNLSMDNLAKLEFADFITEQAALAGVKASDMVLEVTESRLMADLRTPLDILTRLRLKRFRLSIDDFGTGNSSLTQLRDIPFDELKIDQGFVHGCATDETRRGIFNGSLNLARELGMETVAEGVEDQSDWDVLRQSGCDVAQGYFIARPMPASELPAWIESWQLRAQSLTLEAA